MTKKITLVEAKELPETRDGSDYLYRFSLIDASLIGKPEEYFYTTYHEIKVGISGTMEAAWIARQENINFLKVCYEFGKRELVQKVKDGSIQKYQELEITSVTQPDGCPYQSDRIEFSIGATVNFDIGKK
ncbi:MAG: hypothetical protein O6940_04550 [Ignavibacteria bacterium]|nr:hypothetical protein [Ignavibacteria bacterium]